ncbi:hypothetical protein FSP39_006285 [Pinctada imbricata]|uniref:Uncharacterized protein n=1 Tax=Pinctada imbricata TaxID=66713 RepID=A0AA88XES7_PINIB|nr:hypothetical protein FSP39_006285 [Pinctada imbricata]
MAVDIDNDLYYNTQSVSGIDEDLYGMLKEKLGAKDRLSFISGLLNIYQNNELELKHVRESLYDYARHYCQNMPDGSLSTRVQRSNGKTVMEKYAIDIYLLFNYVEGSVSSQVIERDVLSAHKKKQDRLNETINETCIDSSFNTESERDMIKSIVEIKQLIQNNSTYMKEQFERLEKRHESEMKCLKEEILSKRKEIEKLKSDNIDMLNRETTQRSENKLLQQEINTLKFELSLHEGVKSAVNNFNSKCAVIESKLQSFSTNMQKLSSKLESEYHSEQTQQTSIGEESVQNSPKGNNSNYSVVNVENDDSSSSERDETEVKRTETLYSEALQSGIKQPEKSTRFPERNGNAKFGYTEENWDIDKNVFRGVQRRRRRTERIVLYNVDACDKIEHVTAAIVEYAADKGVKVSSTWLLKEFKFRRNSVYMISLNIDSRDFYLIEEDDYFWPTGITWRKWIPKSKRDGRNYYDDVDD